MLTGNAQILTREPKSPNMSKRDVFPCHFFNICLLYMVPDVVVVALHRIFVKVPRPGYFIASIKEPDAHASAAAEKVVYYRLHLVLLLRIEAVVVNCHYVALRLVELTRHKIGIVKVFDRLGACCHSKVKHIPNGLHCLH